MHRLKPFLTLFAFLFCSNVFSQHFKKGYIVQANGDTLQGFIQEASYESLSQSFLFKTERKSQAQHFNAGQVRAFGFREGDHFESLPVRFSIKNKTGWQEVTGQRFLYCLEKGSISLYELRDGQEQPLFIQKQGQPLQLLCFNKDGQAEYRQVLQTAVADCLQLVFPEKIKLEPDGIQALVENYNDCGSLGIRHQVPYVQSWGFGSLSAVNLIDGYKGFGKGLSAEIRPFKYGFRSRWTIGIDYENAFYESLTQRYLYQSKINDLALKTRFFLPTRSPHIVPYGFFGGKMTWEESSSIRNGDNQNRRYSYSYHKMKLQLGVGLQAQFGRHFFRLEAPFDNSANFRLGYGVAFWK